MMKAVIIMTRVPIPGKTKTRLMDLLSAEQCAEIQTCFLKDVLADLTQLIEEEIDLFVSYTPSKNLHLLKSIVPEGIDCFEQSGETLGERMMNSFDYLFNLNYEEIVLIGSDIPELSKSDIKDAFSILEKKDVVLGPTLDGGYYLIGMKKLYKDLFLKEVKWGGKTVLERNFIILKESGLSFDLTSKRRDIDDKEDFFYLLDKISFLEKSKKYSNTISFLKRYERTAYEKRQVRA